MTDDTPRPSRRAVTRAEFEALKTKMEAFEAQSEIAASERAQTLSLVRQMHDALMKPSPGQKRSLLDRMATVTINIESGERVTAWIMRIAGVLAAIGAILAALKWGGK